MNTPTTTSTSSSDAGGVEIGISYLRVSGRARIDTDADTVPDGDSVSAQRRWCVERAQDMRVVIEQEFVESVRSARSVEKHPAFTAMLDYLTAHPDVRYVYTPRRSWMFRNVTDAAITKRHLAALGVTMVSAEGTFSEGFITDVMDALTDRTPVRG